MYSHYKGKKSIKQVSFSPYKNNFVNGNMKKYSSYMIPFSELYYKKITKQVNFESKRKQNIASFTLWGTQLKIYLFTVSNRNSRKRRGICSKLTIKTPEWHHSGGVFWLTLNTFYTFFLCFYCWLCTMIAGIVSNTHSKFFAGTFIHHRKMDQLPLVDQKKYVYFSNKFHSINNNAVSLPTICGNLLFVLPPFFLQNQFLRSIEGKFQKKI